MSRPAALLSILAVSAGLACTGCGSNSGASSSTTQAAATTSTPASAPAKAATNGLGSTKQVSTGGTKLQVKVLKVIDPLPAPKQTGPYQGDRVLGVALSLHNVGKKAYDATPADAGSLRSTGGEGAPSAPFTTGRCAKFEHTLKLAPGATATGCIAYDLLPSHQAGSFTFSGGSGAAPTVWQLG